jgi:hypothetical protein
VGGWYYLSWPNSAAKMAFIFATRSTPTPNGSMHRRDLSSTGALSAILEDGDDPAPPVPLRAQNRPLNKHFELGTPPKHNFERPPPAYSYFDGIKGPNGEKLADLRNNKHIARRGGWKRLALIALIVVLCLVGLVVGW